MKIVVGFLVLIAIACGIHAPAAAQVTVDVGDSNAPWLGYMNVYELPAFGGGFVFGSPWGVADLVATFDNPNNELVLTPNTIGDPDPFWYQGGGGPGALGNKFMEANLYQEVTGTYAGQTVTFNYSVSADTTTSSHNGFAFIKDFAPDYSSSVDTVVPLTVGAGQSISLATTNDPSRHVQFGFQLTGENVWITDVAPFGGITIDTVFSAPPPPIPAYVQDYNSVGVAGTDPTALASGTQGAVGPGSDGKHGWTVYTNVYDSGNNFKFGYGNDPAPNVDPAERYSSVASGQGAGGPADQYMSTFSDYTCCDLGNPPGSQQGHGDNGGTLADDDIVASTIFQEYTVASSDVGRDLKFSFDIKLPGDYSGSGGEDLSAFALGATNPVSGTATGTAEMFIKTLDPNNSYSETQRVDVDVLTGIPGLSDSAWTSYTLTFPTITAGQVGNVFQFGIENFSKHFDPTGVYLDNISMGDAGVAGDFNGDGDVDGRDFLVWQRNPGIYSLSEWQSNFGFTSIVPALGAVPEPSALLLLAFGGCLAIAVRRGRSAA